MNTPLAFQPSRATCQCSVHSRKSAPNLAIENAYWDLAIHVLGLGPVHVPNEAVAPSNVTRFTPTVRAS